MKINHILGLIVLFALALVQFFLPETTHLGISEAGVGLIGLAAPLLPDTVRQQLMAVTAYIEKHVAQLKRLDASNYPIYQKRLTVLSEITPGYSNIQFNYRDTETRKTVLDRRLAMNNIFIGFYSRFGLCRVQDSTLTSSYATAITQTAPAYVQTPQGAFSFPANYLSIYNTGKLSMRSGGKVHWDNLPIINYLYDNRSASYTGVDGFHLDYPTCVLNGRSDTQIDVTFELPATPLGGTAPEKHYAVFELIGYEVQGIASDLENASPSLY